MFTSFKNRLFGSDSKSDAKNRLQFVLVQDRAGLSGSDMKAFRQELMDVIDKYFDLDREAFDVSYRRESESTTLLINSPVVVRRDSRSDGSSNGSRKKRKKNRLANG